MIIYIFVAISIVFLMLNYIISDRDFFNPIVFFCVVNVMSGLLCAAVSRLYNIDIHSNTLAVLTAGLVIFTVSNYVVRTVSQRRRINNTASATIRYIAIDNGWIVLLVLFEIAVGFFVIQYIRRVSSAIYGSGKDIATAIGNYNNIVKNHPERLASAGVRSNVFFTFGQWAMAAFSVVFAGVGVNNYFSTKKVEYRLFVPFAILIVVSFFTGSRSQSFRYITLLLAQYLILRRKATGKKMRGNIKLMARLMIAMVLLAAFFWVMLAAIGRRRNYIWYEYLLAYVGGPIYNLDHFLSTEFQPTELFGRETFRSFYYWFGNRFRIPRLKYELNLPYLRYNGHYMGNVYTMYYMFIEDFGYFGVFPLTLLIAWYYNHAYQKYMTIRSRTNYLSMGMLVFCYLYNDVFMLLFSNRFYENILRDRSLRYYLFLAVACYCLKKGLFSMKIRVRERGGVKRLRNLLIYIFSDVHPQFEYDWGCAA